jgi:hypothetical protein
LLYFTKPLATFACFFGGFSSIFLFWREKKVRFFFFFFFFWFPLSQILFKPSRRPNPKKRAKPAPKKQLSGQSGSISALFGSKITAIAPDAAENAENSTVITENSTGIVENPTGIVENSTANTENATDIPQNATDIPQNATANTEIATDIPQNATEIPQNATEIPQNATKDPQNPAKITQNPTSARVAAPDSGSDAEFAIPREIAAALAIGPEKKPSSGPEKKPSSGPEKKPSSGPEKPPAAPIAAIFSQKKGAEKAPKLTVRPPQKPPKRPRISKKAAAELAAKKAAAELESAAEATRKRGRGDPDLDSDSDEASAADAACVQVLPFLKAVFKFFCNTLWVKFSSLTRLNTTHIIIIIIIIISLWNCFSPQSTPRAAVSDAEAAPGALGCGAGARSARRDCARAGARPGVWAEQDGQLFHFL